MKKKTKKLSLNQETLRNLSERNLNEIAGGSGDDTWPKQVCYSIADTICDCF